MSYHPTTREVGQVNPGCYVLGATNPIDDSKLEKLGGNAIKSSGVPLVTLNNMPPEDYAHSKDTNVAVNMSEHVIPRMLHFESHTGKSDSINVPSNVSTVLERQFNLPDLDFFRLMDKGNVLGCVSDDSNAVTDSAFKVHKQMENPSSSIGHMGRSIDPGFSVVQDKDYYSCQTSNVHPDAFDTRNLFNYPAKNPNHVDREQSDHIALRSMASSSRMLQAPAVSMSFPSAISTSAPVLAPALLRQESMGVNSYLLDDNMRLLALRQILELSKQHHAISSLGANQEPEKCGRPSDVKMLHSLIDLSASGEQRFGPDLSSKQSVSVVTGTSLPSGATSDAGDSNKQAPDRGKLFYSPNVHAILF